LYFSEPSLSAPTYFAAREVAATHPAPLTTSAAEATITFAEGARTSYPSFDALLEGNGTRAFLWLHEDRVVYERYFGRVTRTTQLPSFSMSKTFAQVLVGAALEDHLLGAMSDKIVAYVPELRDKEGYRDITLDQLLRMTSGIDFVEESVAGASLYYSTDLKGRIYGYAVSHPPGSRYRYGSLSVQLLWDAMRRRLGEKTVARYFEERIWGPLGAEHGALWSLDSEEGGAEKLFGGFAATARDHARLGLLFLHHGVANGRRVVSEDWIRESLVPDPVAGVVQTTDGAVRRAKYQWFLTLDTRAFFAKGYRGQYIFVVPEANMVFVRFGEDYGDVDWPGLFMRIARTAGAAH